MTRYFGKVCEGRPTRYFGRVCEKHPELNGERRTANRSCVACSREGVHRRQRERRAQGDAAFMEMRRRHLKASYYRNHERSKELGKKNQKAYRERHGEIVSEREKARKRADRKINPAKYRGYDQTKYDRHYEKIVQRTRHREVGLKRRTPPWADLKAIGAIYREAKRKNLTVDHIVPLRGKSVSGLHVENNLQLLSRAENSRKGINFSQESDNGLSDRIGY